MMNKFSTSNRGFKFTEFEDGLGVACSLSESSSVEPSIWLGKHFTDHLFIQ